MKVLNKVIVVTGGGNGIGRELVLTLLSKGASVAAVDVNKEALGETANLSGDKREKLSTHIVNLTEQSAVEALPEQVISQHGAVDGIINNAGIIQPFVNIQDLDYEKIRLVMDVNFYGTLYMAKAFLPYLLKRPEAHITNISSMGGFLPVPGQSIYGASKAAVKLMTEGLHSELKDTNVKVTVVFPGGVNTNITKNSGAEMARKKEASQDQVNKLLTPKEASEIIVKGMENDQFRVLAGKDSKIMDLFYRFNPKRAADLIAKKLKVM
ncbi:SDR family NAD(P)-dependent oxidoreductase [Pseudalkalibacillus salsuginis]|uniref:SDR family NAD(P)-dependent oxidoreductase n=1 Tax=Pseudalkalibacillus salsuginis TaxID=2910972 RepID=UPI001F1E7D0B|nr:SDR family NAD(P)-dependent oxidoreductase [Pseudalkalibacillus salsuginis]MCF6409556.1 SDR family NAD(P)-dependent oxidoreductase [Pseudalkalibacillus salsuginis]